MSREQALENYFLVKESAAGLLATAAGAGFGSAGKRHGREAAKEKYKNLTFEDLEKIDKKSQGAGTGALRGFGYGLGGALVGGVLSGKPAGLAATIGGLGAGLYGGKVSKKRAREEFLERAESLSNRKRLASLEKKSALENFYFLKQASMQDFYDDIHRMNVEQFGEAQANKLREQGRAAMREAAENSRRNLHSSFDDMIRNHNRQTRRENERLRRHNERVSRKNKETLKRREEFLREQERKRKRHRQDREKRRAQQDAEFAANRKRRAAERRRFEQRMSEFDDTMDRISRNRARAQSASSPAPRTTTRLNTTGKLALGLLGTSALYGGYKYLNRDR